MLITIEAEKFEFTWKLPGVMRNQVAWNHGPGGAAIEETIIDYIFKTDLENHWARNVESQISRHNADSRS
jgi:hypothetical protein